MSDLRDALERLRVFRTWEHNHYEPPGGSPYPDTKDGRDQRVWDQWSVIDASLAEHPTGVTL